MLDFPTSPTIGQQFTAAGVTWTWDGAKWLPSGLSPTVVPGINDNRIINGDMRIDARNNGVGGTAAGYTIDRWQFSATLATKGSWVRSAFGGWGFPYALSWSSTSAYTPLAGDTLTFMQAIEADMVSDFQWGTTSAQPVTLSFIALCNTLTGTFGGSIRNATNTRSYPFTYSLPTANTATKISITIPGDTAGTWVMSGNVAAVLVAFDLGTGATYRGPANAWAGTQYNGATGAVNVCGTNGAIFYVTGVKLEIGSVATPYNRQSLAKSMVDCQRYYQTVTTAAFLYGLAGGNVGQTISYNTQMRAAPTAVISGSNIVNGSALTAAPAIGSVLMYGTVTATGTSQLGGTTTLSAEL